MATQQEYAERRERWAAALESGQYVQAKGQLRNRNGYCCLGVACDLYAKEVADAWTPVNDADGTYEFELHPTALPPKVQKWFGLNGYTGEWWEGDSPENLADRNDKGDTFKEIAAIIRAAPEGLFSDD